MKKITFVALFMLILFVSTSCFSLSKPAEIATSVPVETTYEPYVEPEYPERYLKVGMLPVVDLDVNESSFRSDLYEVLGVVSGSSTVEYSDPDNFKKYEYGSLSEDEVAAIMNNVKSIEEDPYKIALSSAINNMSKAAFDKGASFVIFPNYFVDYDGTSITITVNATAVKMTEGTH